MSADLTAERHLALVLAAQIHQDSFATENYDAQRVVTTANVFWGFLAAPISILVNAGRVVDQTTGKASDNPGGTGMVAIKDTEKFALSVKAFDAKGNEVTAPTDVAFTSSDTTIVSISAPDTNGVTWAVAGNPGSVVVTGDWPDSPLGDMKGTLAVDVTVGTAASLAVEAGDVVAQ